MTMMVGTMRRMIVLLFALAIAGVGPAWAVSNPWTQLLSGTGGNVQVLAQVDFLGVSVDHPYKFTYTLTFTAPPVEQPAWTVNLSSFSVGNLEKLAFFNAGNNKPSYFANSTSNPTYNPSRPKISVTWNASSPYPVSEGSISFWYQTDKPSYKEVDASIAGGSSQAAGGLSLGMTDPAPEPSSLVAIGIGLAGIGLSLKRRRDLSKR